MSQVRRKNRGPRGPYKKVRKDQRAEVLRLINTEKWTIRQVYQYFNGELNLKTIRDIRSVERRSFFADVARSLEELYWKKNCYHYAVALKEIKKRIRSLIKERDKYESLDRSIKQLNRKFNEKNRRVIDNIAKKIPERYAELSQQSLQSQQMGEDEDFCNYSDSCSQRAVCQQNLDLHQFSLTYCSFPSMRTTEHSINSE